MDSSGSIRHTEGFKSSNLNFSLAKLSPPIFALVNLAP